MLTINQVTNILSNHSMEIWQGYAVEQYTNGESFIPLTDLQDRDTLYIWLGY